MNKKGFELKYQARSSDELTKIFEAQVRNDNPLKKQDILTSNTQAKRCTPKHERTKISATRPIDNHQSISTSTSIVKPNEKQEQLKHFLATKKSTQSTRYGQMQNKKHDYKKKLVTAENSSHTTGANEMQNRTQDQRMNPFQRDS
ncbi:hypothetical protein TanjilG_27347 [Lupinus angustifolius]|uniref:Uncharacterized protein n=1 Tax=Lupinus angustifolius TaxID=3871 RepID=A0A394DCE7_LUPAN|nr:hypothetical protein TanjilG_27347 [Lupinus angustifolius]